MTVSGKLQKLLSSPFFSLISADMSTMSARYRSQDRTQKTDSSQLAGACKGVRIGGLTLRSSNVSAYV